MIEIIKAMLGFILLSICGFVVLFAIAVMFGIIAGLAWWGLQAGFNVL